MHKMEVFQTSKHDSTVAKKESEGRKVRLFNTSRIVYEKLS